MEMLNNTSMRSQTPLRKVTNLLTSRVPHDLTSSLDKTKTKSGLSTLTANHSCPIQAIPSFDTPSRKLISPSELSSKFRGFVLGRGSYGVVVKGRYKNSKVAVKIISKMKIENANEILSGEKNALKLKHPNIVKVFHIDDQQVSGVSFVLMEFSNHKNLEELLCHFISLKTKLKYLSEMAGALEYCHSNGILHLDVKPKNIIVNLTLNSCQLCDFGSSVQVTEIRKSSIQLKGTLKYCAPELLKGEIATAKSDVYSFGISMWQIIHQVTPYSGENLQVIVYRVVTQNYRPENKLARCNTEIELVYKCCWEADPKERPSMLHTRTMLAKVKQT